MFLRLTCVRINDDDDDDDDDDEYRQQTRVNLSYIHDSRRCKVLQHISQACHSKYNVNVVYYSLYLLMFVCFMFSLFFS